MSWERITSAAIATLIATLGWSFAAGKTWENHAALPDRVTKVEQSLSRVEGKVDTVIDLLKRGRKMTATQMDIDLEQGADYDKQFYMTDQSGDAINLTGARAAMQIRLAPGDPVALLSLSTDEESLVINARSGTISPVIDAETTASFLPGIYVYDLFLLETNGLISRPYYGSVNVIERVTIYDFPDPLPNTYGNSDGDTYGNSSGDEYGTN